MGDVGKGNPDTTSSTVAVYERQRELTTGVSADAQVQQRGQGRRWGQGATWDREGGIQGVLDRRWRG